MVIKIGILKIGCVGVAPLLEFLLDERAERTDIEVRVVGTGASMRPDQSEDAANQLLGFKPDFAIVVSPNATLAGPKAGRETLANAGVPVLVVSDSPTRRITKELDEAGFGYIINEADAMIGARREFLDPVEVALYNSDILRVLSLTGILPILIKSVDNIIATIKVGEKPVLPRIIVNRDMAITEAGLTNPYAIAKAIAAHDIAKTVAGINTEGCFLVKEWEKYTMLVASAHEMMRYAAKLADEAREIEKRGDTVLRRPHARDGAVLRKTRLIEKPTAS
jgi:methylenetetrahydromethanopterin dehydrogenase